MLDLKPLNRILFLDIETTSEKENFLELSEHKQALFLKRFKKDNNETYYKNSLYLMKQKTSVLRKLKKELSK